MTPDQLKAQIVDVLPRDALIDLIDVAEARTKQAHELIRDHTDLSGRSARGLEGQARFRLMEKGFEDVCTSYGGLPLEGDIIPGTELRVFQPFRRFGGGEPGVVLGLAAMPSKGELPVKNKSRLAGVTMNRQFSPRLNLNGGDAEPQPGDAFVLLLFARDPSRAGQIQEIAIGVIDANYDSYIVYEPVEMFLEGYTTLTPEQDPEPRPSVTLKATPKSFNAPEDRRPDDAADAGE